MGRLKNIGKIGIGMGLAFFMAACSGGNTEKATVRIMALKGPTAIGMTSLMDQADKGEAKNEYSFSLTGTAEEITAALAKGDVDIAAVPCNLASVIYNKTGGIQVLAINTYGVLYIVDATGEIQSIQDLKDKTLYSTGKGTTPEFALNYVLKQNGISPETDLNIEFKSEASELAALLAGGEAEIALLPEPFVTSVTEQNEQVRVAIDLTEEWNKVQADFPLITGTVVVRTEFLDSNPKAVTDFLAEYKKSIEYVNQNPAEAGALTAQYGIIASAELAEKAIPRCNIVYVDSSAMKTGIEGYLGVLFAENPASVGGNLPDENFYYQK